MALITEDGTGLSTAEAYNSVVTFKSFCDGRGLSYSGYGDTVIEQKLRQAFGYLNTIVRYKGTTLTDGQAGEFPRSDLTDWSGRTVSGVPVRVKQAEALLAYKAFTEDLYTDLDRGGKIASESVGPISVSYQGDAPVGRMFREAMKLLEQYARDPSQLYVKTGTAGGAADTFEDSPAFAMGMHDGGAADSTDWT